MTSFEQQEKVISGEKHRILAVDDEASMRELLTAILDGEYYEVTTCSDGKEALKLLGKNEFDLVLTDIVMPRMNGAELTKKITSSMPGLPVIMISAYNTPENIAKMTALGASACIGKPFEVDQILETVADSLANRDPQIVPDDAAAEDQLNGAFWNEQFWQAEQFQRIVDAEIGRAELRDHNFSLLAIHIDEPEKLSVTSSMDEQEIISRFGEIVQGETRPGDVIGVTGQFDLTILLPETSREEAHSIGERIREESTFHFSLSGGVASYPWDGSDYEGMVGSLQSASAIALTLGGGTIVSTSNG